jgi:hypothetical protein
MYNLLGDPTATLVGLDLSITTSSETPTAYRGEAYALALEASNGTTPYTWSIVEGTLPAGLTFNAATGVISGTPTALGDSYVTVKVVDAAGDSDTRELHFAVVERLAVATAATLPVASLSLPYSTSLAATGGTSPYTWTVDGAGTYDEQAVSSLYRGGGTAQGWRADDGSWSLDLPFAFPYFGESYTSVYVCSNGFLDFTSGATDYSNSQSGLLSSVRIAPLWDDLRTNGTGEDIYITATSTFVAIRWAGETYSTHAAVNFEAVLHCDGTIEFNYGAAMSGLSPTIGLSGGDGTHYLLSRYNAATSLAAGTSSRLVYSPPLPAGLALSSAGVLSGTPTEIGSYAINVRVQDSGSRQQTQLATFQLEVLPSTQLSVTLPASTTEGSGTLAGAGTVSVLSAVSTNLTVALTWSTGAEVSSAATVTIPAGHTSATFDLIVANDALLDGTQTARLTAAATNYQSGTASIAVHDNETTVITLSLPDATSEGIASVTGTVTLAAAPARAVEVEIQSSDTSEIAPSGTVLIAAGTTSATFTLPVVDDTLRDGTQTVTVMALVENWTAGSDTISVADNEPPQDAFDLDGSGRVGTGDFALFSPAWHTRPGDANWNAAADFNDDLYVDESDFVLLQQHWLTTPSTSSTSSRVALLDAVLDELGQDAVDEDDLDLLTPVALGGLGRSFL